MSDFTKKEIEDISIAAIGTVGVAKGGTGLTSYTKGDLLYASDTNVLSNLTIGADETKVLGIASGVPVWKTIAGGLPSMTGNDGKWLKTDGTTATWEPAALWNLNGSDIYYNAGKIVIGGNSYVGNTLPYGSAISSNAQIQGALSIVSSDLSSFVSVNGDITNLLTGAKSGVMAYATIMGISFSPLTVNLYSLISCNGIKSNGDINIIGHNLQVGFAPSTSGAILISPSSDGYINFSKYGAGYWAVIGTKSNGDLYINRNPSSRTTSDGYEVMRIISATGNMLIGTTTDLASSILTVSSSTKGILLPRMNTSQVGAISAPAEGLIAYDNQIHSLNIQNGTVWNNIVHSNIANTKVTAAAPYTNDGYIIVTIGGTDYKLMTTT